MEDLLILATQVGEYLHTNEHVLVTAESCTGGGIASAVTAVPGSSAWFDRAFVTYSNTAKREMLGVSAECLEAHGAVSEETACSMAVGALRFGGGTHSVAVTGIAGPDGGTEVKPVGLVWVAFADTTGGLQADSYHFAGDRAAVRRQTVQVALKGLLR